MAFSCVYWLLEQEVSYVGGKRRIHEAFGYKSLQLPSGMKLREDLRGHYRLISCTTRITSLHNRMLQELFFPAMQLYSELPANPYSRIPNKFTS